MTTYEPRDKSSPMDYEYTHPLGRLAQFAIEDDDGPSRKRPHTDLATPSRPFSPFTPSHQLSRSPAPPIRFGTNTPFIFNTAVSLPPTPQFERYDPNKWAGTSFGFGTGSSWKEVEDVDMANGDSPARPSHADQDRTANAGGTESQKDTNKIVGLQGRNEGQNQEPDVRPIASGAVTRVRKKRQKEWNRKSRRRGGDSQSEAEEDPRTMSGPSRTGKTKSEHTYNLHMTPPGVTHSEIPYILLGYLQFFFNASLVVVFLYLAIQFILTVRRDVKDRIEEYSIEILQEIAGCSSLYLTNRCDPSLRVPAMETACKAWETCMNRDPAIVGRARVGAETFAGVINSFVDPISWKTMGFTLVTLTFLIILTNSALFNLRSKQHQQNPSHPQPPQNQHHAVGPPQYLQHQGYPGYPLYQDGTMIGGTAAGQAGVGTGQIGWTEQRKKGWW